MISKQQEAEILRLFHVEKWKIGTIATQLGVHHEAVERVLDQDGSPPRTKPRPSMIDPYVPFIKETFKKYPKLRASRLWVMCKGRGYPGQEDHFRHRLVKHRPRRQAEAFLRLRTLPGEQAQVDWGHFGKVEVGTAQRVLSAFVMVLSWSRQIFLRFYFGQQMENFLRGHQAAFQAWGGLARVHLYDNLKSVVLERYRDAIRFHPTLLQFAAHYRYEPRPVAVARGNEKGRVERAIRYVRDSFFAARSWKDLDDLNEQAEVWCHGVAADRRWPQDRRRTVRQAFEEEKEHLLALPDTLYPTDERKEVTVEKTPYIRFDLNDYSVPHTVVGHSVCLVASLETVRIFDGTELVARHDRCWSGREQIEDPAHIEKLVTAKHEARKHRAIDRLAHAAPSSQKLLTRLAVCGQQLRLATIHLGRLLDTYGAEKLEEAIQEALQKGTPHPHAVRHILEKWREDQGLAPLLPIHLPDDPKVRDLSVRPHRLESYDTLREHEEEE